MHGTAAGMALNTSIIHTDLHGLCSLHGLHGGRGLRGAFWVATSSTAWDISSLRTVSRDKSSRSCSRSFTTTCPHIEAMARIASHTCLRPMPT